MIFFLLLFLGDFFCFILENFNREKLSKCFSLQKKQKKNFSYISTIFLLHFLKNLNFNATFLTKKKSIFYLKNFFSFCKKKNKFCFLTIFIARLKKLYKIFDRSKIFLKFFSLFETKKTFAFERFFFLLLFSDDFFASFKIFLNILPKFFLKFFHDF